MVSNQKSEEKVKLSLIWWVYFLGPISQLFHTFRQIRQFSFIYTQFCNLVNRHHKIHPKNFIRNFFNFCPILSRKRRLKMSMEIVNWDVMRDREAPSIGHKRRLSWVDLNGRSCFELNEETTLSLSPQNQCMKSLSFSHHHSYSMNHDRLSVDGREGLPMGFLW